MKKILLATLLVLAVCGGPSRAEEAAKLSAEEMRYFLGTNASPPLQAELKAIVVDAHLIGTLKRFTELGDKLKELPPISGFVGYKDVSIGGDIESCGIRWFDLSSTDLIKVLGVSNDYAYTTWGDGVQLCLTPPTNNQSHIPALRFEIPDSMLDDAGKRAIANLIGNSKVLSHVGKYILRNF